MNNPYVLLLALLSVLSLAFFWLAAVAYFQNQDARSSFVRFSIGMFSLMFVLHFGYFVYRNPLPSVGDKIPMTGGEMTVIGEPTYSKIEVRRPDGSLSAYGYAEIKESYLETLHR